MKICSLIINSSWMSCDFFHAKTLRGKGAKFL
jgi:hypothetical protein